ncbi:MAG: hypothetical protein OXD31_13665 [Chloroflexi bacterium]|nr:hypothetical protein [Chloroflexota bacterium]
MDYSLNTWRNGSYRRKASQASLLDPHEALPVSFDEDVPASNMCSLLRLAQAD